MADLTASSAAPTVTFDDTSFQAVDWRIKVDADIMHVQRFSAISSQFVSKFDFSDSGHTSYENLKIDKGTPTIEFEHSAGTNFTISTDTSALYLKRGTTTVYTADSNYLYANNGLAAGSVSSSDVIRWSRHIGALGASTTQATITLPYSGRVCGAVVMLTKESNIQSNAEYRLYDYLDTSDDGNEFKVRVNRNTGGGSDTIVIDYNAAYAPAVNPGRFQIIAFHDAA